MTEHTTAVSPTRFFAPLAIILGIPLIFAAIYFYTSPVVLVTGGEQGIFKCGSPSAPNTEAENTCGVPEEVAEKRAIYSGVSGAGLVGLGAAWMLLGRRDDDWDDDDRDRRRRDDDWDDRGRRGRDDERGRDRRRGEEDHDEVSTDRDEHLDPAESRSARHRGRAPGRLDEGPSRRRDRDRRSDDDWASDGWR